MRLAIVCDEYGKWYVRRVTFVVRTIKDETVYHCDWPITRDGRGQFDTMEEACEAARAALDTDKAARLVFMEDDTNAENGEVQGQENAENDCQGGAD